jgi:hypothetical protein
MRESNNWRTRKKFKATAARKKNIERPAINLSPANICCEVLMVFVSSPGNRRITNELASGFKGA